MSLVLSEKKIGKSTKPWETLAVNGWLHQRDLKSISKRVDKKWKDRCKRARLCALNAGQGVSESSHCVSFYWMPFRHTKRMIWVIFWYSSGISEYFLSYEFEWLWMDEIIEVKIFFELFHYDTIVKLRSNLKLESIGSGRFFLFNFERWTRPLYRYPRRSG